jgi:hypothetical protein
MVSREALSQILVQDLGKNYDPHRAISFLRLLQQTHGVTDAELPVEQQRANKNLGDLLENPPAEDTTLHIIYKTPFVLGEVVLAGKKTQREHPRCQAYPIHFKKTYLQKMSRWETSPKHEATVTQHVWEHFEESKKEPGEVNPTTPVPLPLGSSPTTFRSQLLEARSLGSLSPVTISHPPEELAEQIEATKKNYGTILPLWRGMESLQSVAKTLHTGGFLHHDMHRENMLLKSSPSNPNQFEGCLIDFETTEEDERFGTLSWGEACREDLKHLHEEAAVALLCMDPEEKSKVGGGLKDAAERLLKTSPKLLLLQRILLQRSQTQNNTRSLQKPSPTAKGHPTPTKGGNASNKNGISMN